MQCLFIIIDDKQINMNNKQNQSVKISNEMSLYLRYLHQERSVSCKELKERYPMFGSRSIYRHARKKVTATIPVDGRKFNKGPPRKLDVRDERKMLRAVTNLRKTQGSFTVKEIRIEAGLEHVSTRTVNRCLNNNKYRYLKSRRKGLLSPKDKKKRLVFAKKTLRLLNDDFWRNGISFYLDGVSFAHKFNPLSSARATKTMARRKSTEGLSTTAKGKKEGNGGKMAHFFVAIAYNNGVILCKQYNEKLTGESFANFLKEFFPATFERSANARGNFFLQGGVPRQVYRRAKQAMDEVGCRMFSIPARSPHLNPIENVFHLVRKNLHKDALNWEIKKETFEEF